MATAPTVKPTMSPIVKMYSDPKRTGHIEIDNSTDATIHTINFSKVTLPHIKPSGKVIDAGVDPRPRTSTGKLLTDKQIRARARRKFNKLQRSQEKMIGNEEFEWLYKPIEEWSLRELALGRPLPPDGKIPRGPKPQWVTMEVHERSMELFVKAIRNEMNSSTIDALSAMTGIINDNRVDHRGKPIVPPSVKADLAKFLLEHIVGKPKQHITQDISVKLQGLLGSVMVNPNDALASGREGGMFGPESDEAAYTVFRKR
jgi:hypothetical protein